MGKSPGLPWRIRGHSENREAIPKALSQVQGTAATGHLSTAAIGHLSSQGSQSETWGLEYPASSDS